MKKVHNSELTFEEFKKLSEIEFQLDKIKNKKVPQEHFLRPISNFCSHYAVFYDDHGRYLGQKRLKYREKYFSWRGRAFNFLPYDSSYLKRTGILKTVKYYHYNFNNANPLLLDKKCEPILSNDTYKAILDSDLVKKLNPKKAGFLEMIGWKGILLGLVVVFAIYYFASGGTLT